MSGCTSSDACNFNPLATDDDGSCTYATAIFNCDNSCVDANENGLCDEFEGCTTRPATMARLRFMMTAAVTHAETYYNCEGNCINDADSDLVCDELR